MKKTARLRPIRIVEAPSVKVLREFSIAHRYLGQVNIKQRQPILKGLQRETAKDKRDPERAEASLLKIVSIVFDVRINRCTSACDEACYQAHANRE